MGLSDEITKNEDSKKVKEKKINNKKKNNKNEVPEGTNESVDFIKDQRVEIKKKLDKFFKKRGVDRFGFRAFFYGDSKIVIVRQHKSNIVATFWGKRSYSIHSSSLRKVLKNDKEMNKYFNMRPLRGE